MAYQFALKDFITCEICDCTYENPINLPCSIICAKHIKDDKIDCKKCNKEHLVSFENRIINEKLCHLVSVHEKYVLKESILCKNNLKAKDLRDQLQEIIQLCELLSQDHLLYIHEYFSDLRANIDLEREKSIQNINDNYFKILTELEHIERSCVEMSFHTLEIEKSIESTKIMLKKYDKYCEDPCLNDNEKWHHLRNNMEHSIRKIQYALNKFKHELLLNKEYTFELATNENKNTFGDLKIKNVDFNENKLEETIYVEIKEFKSFVSNKLDRYYDKYCVINGIPWKFIYDIEDDYDTNENYELILSAYCIPDCEVERLKQSPFKAQVIFKLLTTNGSVYKRKYFETHYNGISNKYGTRISSISKIINHKNQVYNKQNDSIKLEIEFRIIKSLI